MSRGEWLKHYVGLASASRERLAGVVGAQWNGNYEINRREINVRGINHYEHASVYPGRRDARRFTSVSGVNNVYAAPSDSDDRQASSSLTGGRAHPPQRRGKSDRCGALFSCSQDLADAFSQSTMTLASMQHADRPCNCLSDPLSSGKRSPRKICIASDPYKRTSTTNLVRTWLNDIRNLRICTTSKNSSLYPGWRVVRRHVPVRASANALDCTVSLPRDVARVQGSISLDLKIDWTNNQYIIRLLSHLQKVPMRGSSSLDGRRAFRARSSYMLVLLVLLAE
ncbi:hypothetical protein B0H13DRAFT_2279110 [Mycena leptocephala]|nr:hypothetical protein B0H13DRAFT_2279110 [Mycena leptocephala]